MLRSPRNSTGWDRCVLQESRISRIRDLSAILGDHESTLFHGLNAQGRHEPHPRSPVDVWEDPDARFSWTLNAIKLYVYREQWESVFNALVLLGDSDPKGVGA